MSGGALPAHVRAVFLRPAVGRALREALGAPGSRVALVAGEGAALPELPAGESWRTVGDVRVASLDATRARELATARALDAAAQLEEEPPRRCGWCLYLDAGARCAVVPFPVVPPGMDAIGDA